jgi:Tfp pilus assembly PilM family ATPase
MRAHAGALAVSHPDIVSKLLSIPRPSHKLDDVPIAELLGITDPSAFRIAIEIQDSTAAETHALLAAVPDAVAHATLSPFAQGFPAPQSLEVAGLAAINGMVLGVPAIRDQGALLLDLGAETATVAIIASKKLAFARQFRIGANAIMRKIGEGLGMDGDTALGVVGEGIIDAGDQVEVAFEPLGRQITLARDFVSRRHTVRSERLIVSGGLFQTPRWTQPLQAALGVEVTVWNPFSILPVASGALTPELVAQGSRFAAAAGAAVAAMEANRA